MLARRAFLALLLLPCLVVTSTGPRAGASGDERLHVVVLHTNDVHGQVLPRPATWLKDVHPLPDSGGLPRLAARLEELRAEVAGEGAEVLVVDAGDWFQGTPEGMIEQGRPLVAALASLPYDAMVVGNHEFDHGVPVLLEHLAAVGPPALLANATDDGEHLPGTQPYRIVERDGLKIAVVGFCSVFTPEMTHPSAGDLTWREPAEVLAELRADELADVDWILPVTHQGVGGDQDLAHAHPDLPLIVGGHSHSFLREGVVAGETLIVQAGAKASAIGRVDLWFDRETGRVVEKRCALVELYEEPPARYRNAAVDRACAALVERSAERMEVVVGRLEAPLARSRDRYATSPAGNLITDVMRARAGADVAVQNKGGIRADLEAGPVTRRHLFQVLPFDNHLVTVTLTGGELVELMRKAIEGEAHGGLEFSGMTIELERSGGTPRIARLVVGGAPVDPKARYTVATNSFTAGGGDGYGVLAAASERAVDPILLRDLLEQAFAGGGVTPPAGSRFRSGR